jgi:hypothetical protein
MRERVGTIIIWFSLTSSMALAGGLSDCGLHDTNCRDLIGKRLWVVVPKSNPNSVEVRPTPNDYENTIKMRTGSFLVKDVILHRTSGYDFVVTLPDGKTGYVWNFNWIFLSETDPVAVAAECVRRGQPKIGMTIGEAVATCWGKPRRIVKTTTAAGVQQDFLYGQGRILRFENERLTTILETEGR